jgi:hypothetical protein
MPPSSGPAIAEQLQVTLKAWDHFALLGTSTISAVMTQTELTIPPPPTPDNARAAINHFKSWENITTRRRSSRNYALEQRHIVRNRKQTGGCLRTGHTNTKLAVAFLLKSNFTHLPSDKLRYLAIKRLTCRLSEQICDADPGEFSM